MPRVLSYIEPVTENEHLRMKDGFDIEAVLDVRRVGPDLQWKVVVSREVPETEDA